MNEATEPPNSSVCSHSRKASRFGIPSFFTGIPEIQKKVLEVFHYFIPPYKDQDKAD